MKNITLIILISFSLTSCSKLYKNNTVLSKYENDTLYTKVSPANEKITFMDANVVFEKTATPTVKVIKKKAKVNTITAEQWLKTGTSGNTVFTTDSGVTGWGIALIILGIIVLVIALILFLVANAFADGMVAAGNEVVNALAKKSNLQWEWLGNILGAITLSFFII